MKRIDSPTDVALSQYEGEPEDTTREIILQIASSLCAPIGLAAALKDHFSSNTRYERIRQVFLALKDEIESLKKESAEDQARLQAIEDRIKSPEFVEAVLTAAEEAARTADSRKLNRLASVVANGADPRILQPQDDLSTFVRDVTQLSELDIKTLGIVISTAPPGLTLESYDPLTNHLLGQDLLKAAAREKLGLDEFYSTAYRLVGFGLALEAPTSTGRFSSSDVRFVPTHRGQELSGLLKKRT